MMDLMKQGKLFISNELTIDTTLTFLQQFKYLVSQSHKNIYVYINSFGGNADCANAIIDEFNEAIKNNINVITIAQGCAFSSAAFILANGRYRFATPNSSIMLHSILYELPYDYHKYAKKYTDFADRFGKKILESLAERCGYTTHMKRAQFITMIEDSVWLTPIEAKNLNIIDDIWSYNVEKRKRKNSVLSRKI